MVNFVAALVVALVAQFAFSTVTFAAVDINTASKDELIALPGIGPAKAQEILEYRKANGPFKTVDDLKNVKGIGAKRMEKLRAEIAVGTTPAKVATATTNAATPRTTGPTAKGDVKVPVDPKGKK